MDKRELIDFIDSHKDWSLMDIAKECGVHWTTVQKYYSLVHGHKRPRCGDHERMVKILGWVECNPDVIEWVEGEMEFNLPINTLVKDTKDYWGITWRDTQHIINCLVSAQARRRWQQANKKKLKEVRSRKMRVSSR